MKILIITNLYKNRKEPGKAEFHTQQFKALSQLCNIHIVSPIPFFKFSKSEVPLHDEIDDIKIDYPRFLIIPKILRFLYWLFFYIGVIGCVKRIQKEFDFDAILSLWTYPDGVASYFIGQSLHKPVVVVALGSDINIAGKSFLRRKIMTYALSRSKRVISVSKTLKKVMIDMGIAEKKITVITNGVNTELFYPQPKDQCRNLCKLPLDKKIILFVGNFVPVKGIDVFIQAVQKLSDEFCIVIIGDGLLKASLESEVSRSNTKADIRFIGRVAHNEIPQWMNASDIFCLPSRNEGYPNVLLEALACGIPIVASNVGGVAEIVVNEDIGLLVESENRDDLYDKLIHAAQKKWYKEKLIAQVSGQTWENNAEALFKQLI